MIVIFCQQVMQRSINLSQVFKQKLRYSQRLISVLQQRVQFSSGNSEEDSEKKPQHIESLLKKSSPLKFNEEADTFWATSPYSHGTVFEDHAPVDDDDPLINVPEPEQTSVIMFPGQGTQYVGMAKNLLKYPIVNDLFDAASDILKYNLLKLCLEGPEEKLNQTEYCQPAVLVCSLAALEKLKDEKPWAVNNCVATCGFSLGEYSSLVFAGCMNFERAVRLVKLRAEAMQISCNIIPGGMITVLYGPQSDLPQALKDANEHVKLKRINAPECAIANYLFPGCKVIAGHTEALNYIITNYKKYRIRKISQLPVAGAFHTGLMKDAADLFESEITKVEIKEPVINVYSNITAKPYRNAYDIKKKLPKQIYKPVKWEQLMHNVFSRKKEEKFPYIYECGPGNSLSVILNKINVKASKSCYAVRL